MGVSERSEQALKIDTISLYLIYYAQYIQKAWSKFVGAHGQLPTLPSPKSGPGWGIALVGIILLLWHDGITGLAELTVYREGDILIYI